MVFSSSVFLFVFLPVTLIGYWLLRKHISLQNVWLLLASIFFYAWGEPSFIFIILISSVINWILSEKIKSGKEKCDKRRFLILAMILNLGIFIVFKYLGFIIDNVSMISGVSITGPDIRLPIGISFFSFQVMSYQIDSYRGEIKEKVSLPDFMLYALMFPQLVAGPIVRFSAIAKNINNRECFGANYTRGVKRFVIGLSKKVLLADHLAVISDNAYYLMDNGSPSIATSWIGAFAFILQLYYDFSGYSDMAIGLGEILGFRLPENFNYPYISASVTEFWRRWHMTLYTWFRDYLYIPLGGSRVGKVRTFFNIFLVWALTGLWHGAGWNYILWGISYFVVMTIEKWILRHVGIPKVIGHVYTIILTCIIMVFLHITKLNSCFYYIKCMFGGCALYDNDSFKLIAEAGFLPLIAIFFCYPWGGVIKKELEKHKGLNGSAGLIQGIAVIALFILCISMCVTSSYSPFIYFNF